MSTGLRQVWNQNATPTDHDAAQAALRQQWGNENIFTSNLVSGLKGYGGSSALGAANLAEVVGADAAAQGLRRKASSLLMDAQQAGTHHAEMGSVNNLGTLWDSAKANMGQGLGSMAPIIAAAPLGIAPGVLAATAPMYGENIARLERDPTLAGMTPGEKALHAAPTAAAQGAMNYIVPGGVAANMGRRFAAKTGTGVAGKAGVTLGTVMGVEGATEAGEEYARQAMHTAANPERDKTRDAQELIQAGYSGALGGSPIGAMQAAGGYVQDTLDARAQDTRTLAQKAGDAIADAGGALGKRAGEREGAQIDEALNSLEREAKERGVSPREVLAERVEALNKPVDLTAARTEAEAAEIVTADYQNKQAMTDQLAEDILMDRGASPAELEVAKAHIAGRQAGAENKHEETALNLNEINKQRDGIMGLVDTIAKAIEPIAGKPAPKNRGSAMKPEKLPYTDAELYRHSQLYDMSAELRTLPLTELSRLDKTIERFAQGEFGPEVRKTLDKIFGTPEATEAVLELYKPGTSGTRGQEYDPNGGVTGADRTVLSEDEGSVIEATPQETANELPTDTSTKWGSGSFKLGENSYFDTKDAAQAERLGKTVSALGKETAGARPTVKKIGMVDAELERRFGDDVSPEQKRALQVEITNEFFPTMQVMEETPANFDQMNRLAQADYKKRFEGFQRELNRRVRATNNRFQTAKAVSEATKGGGLDYNHDDIKSLALNMGSAGIANPKASPTNGTLLFERSDAKSPLITSAPQLLRRAFQIGPDREQTDDTGAIEDLFNLLNMSTASVLDYSKRGENAEREFGERQARGDVTEYDVAPDAPKMRFTGRIGYVKYGKEVWVDKLQDLPDNFKLLERGGRRYTVGDLKDALAKKNADTAVEASVVRSRLEKMVKEGRFNSLEKAERAKITQAISAHKKNPQNAVAAGALNALYAKHVGAVYKDGAPEERGAKTRTLEDGTVEYLDDSEKYDPNAGKVASEVEDTQDSSGSPLELGQRKYDVPNQPIQRGADGTTSSNPGYNVIGAAQPRGKNAPRSEPNRPDRVQPTSTEEITDTAEIFDDETGQLKTKRRTDDFGNAVTTREVPVAEKKVERSVPDDGFGNRVASTTVKAGRSSAPTTAQDKSRNEDRMDPGTKPLPESARALYKTESPGEWVASVLAPRGGVEAALKAWSTVKNATTEKMQRSKMLFARALHTIADMQPESFRLEFNKKLTAQQSQTMIDRAKRVIEQGKVPDDRPRVVDKGAAESRPLGESRQDDNGSARQARDADARVVPGAATNTGPVAQELQRPDTGAVARGAETEVAPPPKAPARGAENALSVTESSASGYRQRTQRNANAGDVTIAFATDYTTAGERLTKNVAGDKYIAYEGKLDKFVNDIVAKLKAVNGKTINVAGNGIYTWAKDGRTQEWVNKAMYRVLRRVKEAYPQLEGIVTGGQTGTDIAGAVAARALGLNADVHMPKGFMQRNEQGVDFKQTAQDVQNYIEAEAAKLGETKRSDMNAQVKFTDLTKNQIAELSKQSRSKDLRASKAAEEKLRKLDDALYAKAKEIGQIKDAETRLKTLKRLFETAHELDMEYDEFSDAYQGIISQAPVGENAFSELRNDIARFASKEFVADLDQDIKETVDRLENIEDDLIGDINEALDLFTKLKDIKAEQEAQQAKLFNKQGANAQAPNNTADATKRAAELKKAIEEVKRLLGADFDAKAVNALFDPVTNAEWSGEFSPTEMKILIAAGATDAVGTGRHEAMHALFKMLKDMGHPQATKVIENLATNPLIMRKLKVLLADEKAALEQLKDPEEAAAYLFQFWMAGQIELGPQAKTFFQQVMKWLDDIQLMLREKVFGSKAATNEREQRRQNELAETLLAHFRDGAMAAPEGRARVQAVLEKNAKAVEARRLNTRAFGHKFHKFMEKGIYSAASIFEDSTNPHVKEIGRMFFRLEGDVKGQNQNFIEAAGQWNDKYQVELRNILTSIDNETMGLVSKYMNDRTPLDKIHHPEAKAAVTKLRELLKQLYLYQKGRNTARWDEATNSWQLLGEIKENYYPRVWSIGALTDKQGEFLEKMTKALEKYRRDHKGFPDIEEFDAAKVAQGILNKLINGNGNNGPQETESDIGITPWQASVNKRDLNWLDDVAPGEFTDFLSQDVSEVMTSYIAQATKRAEYSKAFGRGGENLRNKVQEAIAYEMNPELMDKAKAKLKDMLDAHEKGTPPNLVSAMRAVMRAEKVPEAEVDKVHADAVARLEPVTKAIMAMEGTLGREIDPNLRHVMSGVTTFQNFRLLPLALFASINDVVGMVARGGSMKDSFQAFARGVREVGMMWKGTYSKDELAKLAESLGTVGAGNYLDSMGQTYSSQFMYGKLRRWNDKLFKWNGLEAWNRAVRIQATGVAIEFIKRHVEKPNEHSKRYLEELFGNDYDTSQIMKNGDLDYSSEAVQQAILSWVNGAVLRPNAAHRPVYASDPHYMLFFHLKQFAYSFHKVILRRTWVEAKEGNYTPAAALFVGYVPVSIAADVMKELLIVGDDDPWWTKGGLTDYLEHGIARANLGGVPQMWLGDTMADPLNIFNNPEGVASRASNVLGPAPDQLIDLLTVPMFDNKFLSRELAGGVPGGVLLRRYVD